MSTLSAAIQASLEQTNGNIQATAMRLGVSPEYVRQLKSAPSVQVDKFKDALAVPQPLVHLKDGTVKHLEAALDEKRLPPALQVRLLKVLLDYELRLYELARPVMNYIDRRTAMGDITVLIDKMDGLDTDTLRWLARDGPVIEGSVIPS